MSASAPVAGYITQRSNDSVFDFFPKDPIPSLPYELVVEIFHYVPPPELICVCRLVSRTWKELLDDPPFWEFLLRKNANFTPKLMEVPAQAVHWPKLYFFSAWRPNLVQSFDSKGELSLKPWDVVYVEWDKFSRRHVYERENRDEEYRRHQYRSGGDNWAVESGWIKPEDPNYEQLIKENKSNKNYVTSYQWCCRKQVIDLSKYGFVDSIMDTVRPPILVSEWFSARWDCGSVFNIQVALLDSEKKMLAEYKDSIKTDQWQGGELGWRKVEHVFRDYGSGVRFVCFADAGKDTQFWAGHYGSKMAGARVIVNFK